jgi:succinyl-CoA synthetase beta subunit
VCVRGRCADGERRGATPETVKKAFELLLADPNVKSIFINIFGGMRG